MGFLNRFQLSLFVLLLVVLLAFTQAFAAIRAAEDCEMLFPEKPAEGIEFDPVDTYDSEELNALVKEVTEYHYGFSCNEYDTIPLMAPDGEYRALLILFSLDTELGDSYSTFLELSNQERNLLRLMGVAVKDDDYELVEYYRQSAVEYGVMLDSYYTFFVASVDKSLIPLGSIRNIDIKVNEYNFTRDNLIFKDLGLLPSPDFYKSTSGKNYSVVSVAEDENGQRYWYKIPESELVDKLWLLYVPEHSCDWKDWSVFSNHFWPIDI